MISYVLYILDYICLIIFVLVGVAFFTLLERKVLGYIQIRKGPNKVGIGGVLQPFADAIKLFTKISNNPESSNLIIFYIRPGTIIFVMMLLWLLFMFSFNGLDFKLGLLYFLCCRRVGVYNLFCAGWASNSKYALLGSLRGVAQSISYEVVLALILLRVLILVLDYNLNILLEIQKTVWLLCISPLILIMWFISILAETNRTPFDFAEGESELVSGFNVEYSGALFALLFISEYGSIIFMRYFIRIIYFGGGLIIYGFVRVLFIVLFIWVRGTIPRFRYDKLIYLVWRCYLPVILNYLLFFNGIMIVFVWF